MAAAYLTVLSACGGPVPTNPLMQGSGSTGRASDHEEHGAAATTDDGVPETVRSEMMARWNAAADGVTVPREGGEWDFVWRDWHDFPHPTFRTGSVEVYTAFAGIVESLLSDQSTFEFMRSQRLFDQPLLSGGDGLRYSMSLAGIAGGMAEASNFPQGLRATFAKLYERMTAAE
jgi:hypothetical protein